MNMSKISGKIGVWINQFLTNRIQYVIVNGEKSEIARVRSGVPQGTVLGPVLFIIMISDIGTNIRNHISLYADDSRLYGRVKNESDALQLQQDLEKIYKWADINNMEFNSKKFELLRFGKSENLRSTTNYISPTGEIIEEKVALRDLGITMKNDLTFDEHTGRGHISRR